MERSFYYLLGIIVTIGLLVGVFAMLPEPEEKEDVIVSSRITDSLIIETPAKVPTHYVGKVRLGSTSLRMLVLKHCPDSIADIDADQALQAANLASNKGLKIHEIGNYRVDADGKTDRMQWCTVPLDGLKDFVSEQMKVGAEPGDTLIVYTIGHGGGDGSLMRIGQRGPVMKMLAEAAEENDQLTFWWQLSCHAAASLPAISTLTPRQQELFVMAASSPANEVSYFSTQGAQFEAMFLALADKSETIDPDQDSSVTVKELQDFLNTHVKSGRGDLLYGKSPDTIVFGFPDMAGKLPIIGPDGSQIEYPDRYIPVPGIK